jgi:uncharacterized membrane protein
MTRSIESGWRVPALLILLSMVPAAAGTVRLGELASGAEITEANARFFAMPLPIVLHLLTVIPFSVLGALQFAPSLHRRGWHRRVGRVLVVCGFVAALTGLWMAHFYPWPKGDGAAVYVERLVFGFAMLVSMALAVDGIRRRDFGSHPGSHGAWMTRAYAIGMGAGTQVLTHLPWFILVDAAPGELPRAVMMGAGWVVNVVVAEWAIRRRRAHRRHGLRPAGVVGDLPTAIVG